MKAYIKHFCVSGIGDQYSSLLSSYKVFKDLKEMGYEVELVWEVQNQYFSSELPLDCLFDHSRFDKVSYVRRYSQVEGCILVPQEQRSIEIHVSEMVPSLETYSATIFSFSHYSAIMRSAAPVIYPDSKIQFLSPEVLDKVELFRKKKSKFKGIHFRVSDYHLTETYSELLEMTGYRESLDKVELFILKNIDSEVMVCSNNKNVINALTEKFSNTFKNTFTHDLPPYYSYSLPTIETKTEEEFIVHAQETAAEMAMFKYCDEIFTYNSFPSSFLTYGITHNVHHIDWNTKLTNLGLL